MRVNSRVQALQEAQEIRAREEAEKERVAWEISETKRRAKREEALNGKRMQIVAMYNRCRGSEEDPEIVQEDLILRPYPLPVLLPKGDVKEFEVPEEFMSTRSKRSRRDDDQYEGADSKHHQDLPPGAHNYRKLRRNLYNPPLQRAPLTTKDDAPICQCLPSNAIEDNLMETEDLGKQNAQMVGKGGCDLDCQNRFCYMECYPGTCPSIRLSEAKRERIKRFKNGYSIEEVENGIHLRKHASDGFTGESESEPESDGEEALYCRNTAIQRKKFPRTEVFGTPECGFGLRVLEDVETGDKLLEYLGEVITTEMLNERMAVYIKSDDFYFAALGDGLFLDAKPMGSTARFANHSCDPTCQLQKWVVHGEPRIVLTPLRPLRYVSVGMLHAV